MAQKRRVRQAYADDPVLVGRRLRSAREAAGLSQRALSFPGCTAAYISRIEAGERLPSLQLLREFAHRLGVTEEFLAFGHDAISESPRFVAELRVAIRLGDLETAATLTEDAIAAAKTDRDRADAFVASGEVALHQGDTMAARIALEHACELDTNLEERDPQAAEVLGRVYARAFEYEQAAAVFIRNRDRAARVGDLAGEVRFAALLANAFVDAANFSAAEQVLAEILSKCGPLTDQLSLAKVYWSQSRLHALQNDSANAARAAQRALNLLEGTDHQYYYALAHQLLAHIELDRGNSPHAAELLANAAPIIERSGRRFELTSFRIEQARALLKAGRRKEAAAVALEAATLMSELSSVDAGRSYALVAEIFLELGDEERALELFELAVEHLQATPNRYLVEAYAKLAQIYEDAGDQQAMIEALKAGMRVQQRAERVLAE